MRCYGFIYNPRSGSGHRPALLRASVERLRAAGHEVREYLCDSDRDGDPSQAAEAAVRDACGVLVACGGDGTVNAVARVAKTHHLVLGVLPFGTLNHFAKDLGIHGTAHAEQVLLAGHIREIDAGLVNGRLFLNNAGIGIYPMMVLERERVQKAGIPKWPAFVAACVKIVLKMPFRRLCIKADGVRLARTTPFLFVGNNVYSIEGKSLGRRACLDAGVLGVCTARHVGPAGLFRFALRALMGTLRQDRDFTALTTTKLTVERKRRRALHVSRDGEVCRMRLPLEFSTVPRAIQVLAP